MAGQHKANSAYVVDSFVVASVLLPDERKLSASTRGPELIKLLENPAINFLAPKLLIFEVGNILRTCVLRGRLDQRGAKTIFQTFMSFPINYLSPNYEQTLRFSLEHNCSYYDSSYAQLALEQKAKLLTLDRNLRQLYQKAALTF